MLKKIFDFFHAFKLIEKNRFIVSILAFPCLLLFVILNLVTIIFDEEEGSVVSNEEMCAKIGKQMLQEGGSVVDAAIAVMFCEGVALPNRAGIGGGFTALLYARGFVETVTATPTVPQQFDEKYILDKNAIDGPEAGGVPGELLGYWEMHRKYGFLPWRYLIEPTIQLCEEGFPMTDWMELDMQRNDFYLFKNAAMRQLYFTLMENKEGNTFKFRALARTLRTIAKLGPKAFYHGDIGKAFIEDIREAGGVMSMEDLKNYNVSWDEPIIFNLPGKKRGYTTGLPSMGAMVAMVLNVMKSSATEEKGIFWHRTIETMKHAFAMSYNLADIKHESDKKIVNSVQKTFDQMIDMDFATKIRDKIKNDRLMYNYNYYNKKHQATVQAGTSNICVIAPTGEAIVISSSLMWDFGTFAYSPKTGIFLNTQLRSFAPRYPRRKATPSPAQILRAGKRAVSPHAPTMVMDRSNAKVTFIVGAAGSALIPIQVITALINFCIEHKSASYAANSGFFYPDPNSNNVSVADPVGDDRFDEGILEYLKKVGHNLIPLVKENPYTIRTCIAHDGGKPDIQFTYQQHGGMEVIEPGPNFNTLLLIVAVSMSMWILSWLIYELAIGHNWKV